MNKRLLIRKAHRYIGIVVAIQLFAWSLGGVWFSWNDLDKIHGDHLKINQSDTKKQPINPPQKIIDGITDMVHLQSLKLINFIDRPAYLIDYLDINDKLQSSVFDAETTKKMAQLNQQQAIITAQLQASFKAEIKHAELLTETTAHHEFRKKPLPVWAITFEHPGQPTFYISAHTAELVSVRHNDWRIFDFFWMLHTMDYEGRDNFGNLLIKVFSLIAVLSAISGIILFIISTKKTQK